MGPDALNLSNTLPYPSDADKEDPEKVLELLDQRCIGKKNIIYERYRFHSRKQYEGKSFDTFLTALSTLASTCDFQTPERTEEELRDQIVCGIASDMIRSMLLQQFRSEA